MGLEMALWLLSAMGIVAAMIFWNRRKGGRAEQVGSSEDFSNVTMYFDPIHGEGHLFIGGIMVIVLVALFFYEFAKILRGMIF